MSWMCRPSPRIAVYICTYLTTIPKKKRKKKRGKRRKTTLSKIASIVLLPK
jgi:hypothetical protein